MDKIDGRKLMASSFAASVSSMDVRDVTSVESRLPPAVGKAAAAAVGPRDVADVFAVKAAWGGVTLACSGRTPPLPLRRLG